MVAFRFPHLECSLGSSSQSGNTLGIHFTLGRWETNAESPTRPPPPPRPACQQGFLPLAFSPSNPVQDSFSQHLPAAVGTRVQGGREACAFQAGPWGLTGGT